MARFLVIVMILLVLAGGLLLTDYNMQQLQGTEGGALQLDGEKIRGTVVRFSAAAVVLVEDCCSFLNEVYKDLRAYTKTQGH